MTSAEYQVAGMTCGHCEMSIRERRSGEIASITDIQVNAQIGKLVVSAVGGIDDEQVVAVVREAGCSGVRVRQAPDDDSLYTPRGLVATFGAAFGLAGIAGRRRG